MLEIAHIAAALHKGRRDVKLDFNGRISVLSAHRIRLRPSAFSERGSMTRSTSARTRSDEFHHTDLTIELAAGRRPALRPLLCRRPLLIAPDSGSGSSLAPCGVSNSLASERRFRVILTPRIIKRRTIGPAYE